MFKRLYDWYMSRRGGYSNNTGFLEEVRKEKEAELKGLQDDPDPAIDFNIALQTTNEMPEDDSPLVGAKVSYFTLQGDKESTVYLDISTAEHSEQAVKDLAKIIAGTFNIKVQAQTIGVIRENLIKSERLDLLELFMKTIITASAESGVNSSLLGGSGKEKPCVSPTDVVK